MGQHTPTPWRTTKNQGNVIVNEGGDKWIAKALIGNGKSSRFYHCEDRAEANAEFIVTAVNSHATLTARNAELESEVERLRKAINDALKDLDGEPEYHDQGMGCGLEDRCITDRYDAMYHGWSQAMERVYGENIAWAKESLSAALSDAKGEAS